MTQRQGTKQRRKNIIKVAMVLAEDSHYQKVGRREISEVMGITGQAVVYHFGNIANLRYQLIREAIAQKRYKVIAQAIVAGDKQATAISKSMKEQAFKEFM